MRKICIVGNVGKKEDDSCSGQILRTRILCQYLTKHYGNKKIKVLNTDNYKKNAFKLLTGILSSLFTCDIYILMLSRNGRKVFFPIMYVLKKILRKHVFNNIIGGDYVKALKKNENYIKFSNCYDLNWVQTKSMKKDLEKLGVVNVEVLPNSKPQKILDKKIAEKMKFSKPYKFCTFSRIIKEKGIEDAIDVVENINLKYGRDIAELHIFGSVEKSYEARFKKVIERSSDKIYYDGYVSPENTTDVLKEMYILLFPTTWDGEGFPGTVLDAYAAGLPVIATDWNCNSDVIEDGFTGFLYNYRESKKFFELVSWAIENENEIKKMKINCINEASRYTPDNVMPIVMRRLISV